MHQHSRNRQAGGLHPRRYLDLGFYLVQGMQPHGLTKTLDKGVAACEKPVVIR